MAHVFTVKSNANRALKAFAASIPGSPRPCPFPPSAPASS